MIDSKLQKLVDRFVLLVSLEKKVYRNRSAEERRQLLVYDSRGHWRKKSVVIVQMMQSVAACAGKLKSYNNDYRGIPC